VALLGEFADPARHANVQAVIIGVQHTADSAQLFEGPVLYR
jgi:hypothetical protein